MNWSKKSDIAGWTRRGILQAAAATGSTALLPWGGAIAQNLATTLLRAPKQALIVGNSAYKRAPLKNPGNDAKGMAEVLKAIGFDVVLGTDLGQAAMSELIRAYVERLSRMKAVGLFYFAGHGTQLAWRNYIVPLDAEISSVELIKERCIDINTLIAGIRKAGNPMNVIVLDACRDNPFGSQIQLDQKGLSQLDAPPGTLLAYATAPGNTAIDGEGVNGLYTEHLLREIKVPEAKIEDVFKRVRLGVRRGSRGSQVPWESTSLEEDFWFIPPRELKKLAEAEIEREFKIELDLWEKIKTATQPEAFEDYLRRYPSGRFSELAQFHLDRVLARQGEHKIQIISPVENPYSKGTVVANTNRQVGDSYTYRVTDLFTKSEVETFTETITQITDNEIIYSNGHITDLLGNKLRHRDGIRSTGAQVWGVDYFVGKRWVSRTTVTSASGSATDSEVEYRVVAREKFTSPAGSFDAFVVEGNGWGRASTGATIRFQNKRLVAPDRVRADLVYETLRRRNGMIIASVREELVAYRQS